MEQESGHAVGKCFGTTVVGHRGQLVIPVEARKELGVDAGTKLLVFSNFRGKGLIFVKVEAVEPLAPEPGATIIAKPIAVAMAIAVVSI